MPLNVALLKVKMKGQYAFRYKVTLQPVCYWPNHSEKKMNARWMSKSRVSSKSRSWNHFCDRVEYKKVREKGCFDREREERTKKKEGTLLLSVSVNFDTQGLAGSLEGGAVEGVAGLDELCGHDGRGEADKEGQEGHDHRGLCGRHNCML